MYGFSQSLTAFGVVCGIAAWFLFQKTASKLIQHLRANHAQIWEDLGRPKSDDPPLNALTNIKFRNYILQKEYRSSSDLFVNNMGALLRQRLLFSLFCLICAIAGVVLILLVTAIN